MAVAFGSTGCGNARTGEPPTPGTALATLAAGAPTGCVNTSGALCGKLAVASWPDGNGSIGGWSVTMWVGAIDGVRPSTGCNSARNGKATWRRRLINDYKPLDIAHWLVDGWETGRPVVLTMGVATEFAGAFAIHVAARRPMFPQRKRI